MSDDQGLIEMLPDNIDYFKSKPVNIPKITILLDNGYHPEKLEEELKKFYPQIMTKIRFKLSPKPSKTQKEKEGRTGFVPVKARWVIERTNSWMERCKSLMNADVVNVPGKLPFLESICWQTANVYEFTLEEMLSRYERGWKYRNLFNNLADDELELI